MNKQFIYGAGAAVVVFAIVKVSKKFFLTQEITQIKKADLKIELIAVVVYA